MKIEVAPSELADQEWRGLYCVGGIMGVLTGVGWLAASRMGYLLYNAGYPSNAEAYLQLVSQKHVLANSLWSLWIFGHLSGFVASIATYLVLRRNNRTLALLGALFVFFYLFYDISVTELNSLTLVSLSQGYASASTDAVKASYVTAATYGYAALPLQTVLSFAVGAIGWLLWSVVMLQGRSIFPRWMGGPRRHRQRHRDHWSGSSSRPGVFLSGPYAIPRRPTHRCLGDSSRGPTVSLQQDVAASAGKQFVKKSRVAHDGSGWFRPRVLPRRIGNERLIVKFVNDRPCPFPRRRRWPSKRRARSLKRGRASPADTAHAALQAHSRI